MLFSEQVCSINCRGVTHFVNLTEIGHFKSYSSSPKNENSKW